MTGQLCLVVAHRRLSLLCSQGITGTTRAALPAVACAGAISQAETQRRPAGLGLTAGHLKCVLIPHCYCLRRYSRTMSGRD
jgi:hypothetical protein